MASVQNHYRKYLKQFAFQQKSQEKVLQKIFHAKNLTRVKMELSILYGSQNIPGCLKNKYFAEDIKLWVLIKL